MFNKLLGKVDGADTWMVLSLIIFGVFFIAVIVRIFLMKKSHIDYVKNLPFNENEN